MKILQDLLSFIEAEQDSRGGFLSISSTDDSFKKSHARYLTTFFTSHILLFLKNAPPSHNIVHKGFQFLLSNASTAWTWNYWDRATDEYTHKPYPDDADDTCSALAAILTHAPGHVSGDAVTKSIHGLTQLEAKEGGPYKTWYTSNKDPAWNDIDLGVNCMIGRFLSCLDISLESIVALIETALQSKHITSRYYPDPIVILYFISHMRSVPVSLLPPAKNPLQKALLASILLKQEGLSKRALKEINWLLKNINLVYKPYRFCYDPSIQGKPAFAGCSALTASACYECFFLYEKLSKSNHSVISHIRSEISDDPILLDATHRLLENSQSGVACYMLPYVVAQACEISCSKHDVENLAIAQAYGWLGYSLLDDCLDEKTVEPLVPALRCIRLMHYYFQLPSYSNNFSAKIQEVCSTMEKALIWEQLNCTLSDTKIPDYGDYAILAQKAWGYILGALGVLALSHSPKRHVHNLENFFFHMLIAKQLGDDAHDWEDDLESGRVNSVGAYVLKNSGETDRSEYFWDKGIDDILKLIEFHVEQAEGALAKCTFIKDPEDFLTQLAQLKKMCEVTRRQKDTALALISASPQE